MTRPQPDDRQADAWEAVRDGLAAYELVRPGDPSFVCRAADCTAHCCHALTVPLDDPDVSRLAAHSGLPPAAFLECEDGLPIALPLRHPFVMARADGHCVLLAADLSCSQYEGRPAACRAYPFQVVLVDLADRRVVPFSADRADSPAAELLLVRHRDCPGFTGPALDAEGWRSKVAEIVDLAEDRAEPTQH